MPGKVLGSDFHSTFQFDCAETALSATHPSMLSPTGIEGLSFASRLLLTGARTLPGWFGASSCFRKLVRRNRGKSYHVQVKRGFQFRGRLGDSVDNQIAIQLDYEPGLSEFIISKAAGSDSFLDIGCNVGWFSCLAASLPDRPSQIFAIDANPAMVASCQANLQLNGFTCEHSVCALGPKRGTITLHIPERRHSRASVGLENAKPFGDTREIEVEMVTLGDLLSNFQGGRCDIIKMDIEGYELEALRMVPVEIALNVGMFVFEYSRANLEGCGFGEMTLSALPWLEHFKVEALEDDGSIHEVTDPKTFRPKETTIILTNRSAAS
jgi:FkbM family methyltransferase